MGYRAPGDVFGTNYSPYVDKMIGSAFWIVKKVHDELDGLRYIVANMGGLLSLSAAVSGVSSITANMTALLNLVNSLPMLTTINTNLAALLNVGNNSSALVNLSTNLAALLNVNSNLSGILAAGQSVQSGSKTIVVPLTVTATNVVSALPSTYDGGFAIAFVNGQGYTLGGNSPPFTLSGTTLTWDPNASGKTLNPGTTSFALLYSHT